MIGGWHWSVFYHFGGSGTASEIVFFLNGTECRGDNNICDWAAWYETTTKTMWVVWWGVW